MKPPVRTAYLGILALLSTTWLASRAAPRWTPETLQRPLAGIGLQIAGWKTAGPDEELKPGQLRASSYLSRTYVKNGQALGLLIAFHDSHQAAVNVHTPKNCLPADGWEIWKSGSAKLAFEGRTVVINQYHIYRMDHRMVVLYWYQSRGRVAANEYVAKFMLMRDALFDGRTSGAFVRIVLPDRPELLFEGLGFAQAVMPQIQFCFRP